MGSARSLERRDRKEFGVMGERGRMGIGGEKFVSSLFFFQKCSTSKMDVQTTDQEPRTCALDCQKRKGVYDPSEFGGDRIVGIIETNSLSSQNQTKNRMQEKGRAAERRLTRVRRRSTARTCW